MNHISSCTYVAIAALSCVCQCNALSCEAQCRLLQFADDTTVICSGENYDVVRDNLISDMERIQAWIASNRMRLNVQKLSVMWFSSKRPSDPPILVN